MTSRYIPITASETVAASGSVAISGSYSDSFAQGNPGSLYLGITDSSGTLSATDASGQAVAGSGTDQIGVSADYVDLNAILASLHYMASSDAGSDTISFDVWNQAGKETTGATAMTITATQGASMTMADLAAPAMSSNTVMPSGTSNTGPGHLPMPDTSNQPIGLPLTLHS